MQCNFAWIFYILYTDGLNARCNWWYSHVILRLISNELLCVIIIVIIIIIIIMNGQQKLAVV